MVRLRADTLKGKRILIMGRLKNRRGIVAKIELAGGLCRDKLNSLVNIAIVPDDIDGLFRKCPQALREAREMEERGHLKIMHESEFTAFLSDSAD